MDRYLRRAGLLLALILFPIVVPAGRRAATAQIGGYTPGPPDEGERYHVFTNRLQNGDFEEDDDLDAFPDGWIVWPWGGGEGPDLRRAIFDYLDTSAEAIVTPRLSTRYPFFGKRSLELRSTDGHIGPGVYTTGVFPPGIYTLSLYAKNPAEGRRRLGVFLATGGRLFEVGKRWRNVVLSRRVPFHIATGEISIRDWTFSPGTLLVDHAVLVRLPFDVRYPARFDVDPGDARFVIDFADVPEVSLPVGINLEITPPGGETVRKNIEGVLESPADRVVFEFDAADPGRYRLELEIYDLRTADVIYADSDIAAERAADSTGGVPDAERPGAVVMPEGSALPGFFPIGIRAHGYELGALEDRGFNCVVIEDPRPDALDEYNKHLNDSGLKCFYEVDSDMCKVDADGCEAAFRDLVRSSALLDGFSGWFLRSAGADETEEGAAESPVAGWIRESDPGRPVILEDVLPGGALPRGGARELYVALDPTPVSTPLRPLSLIGLWADRLAETAGTGIRTIGMPQAFGGWPLAHRAPTFREVRAMTYLAVLHGAQGIVFRDFSSPRPAFDRADASWDIRKSPGIWENLPGLNGELLRLSPWFLRSPEPAGTIGSDRPDVIDQRAWREGGTMILVAVNVDDEAVEGRFSTGARFEGEVEVLFEERALEAGDGGFSDRFLPFETHVYRMEGGAW